MLFTKTRNAPQARTLDEELERALETAISEADRHEIYEMFYRHSQSEQK